MFDKKHVLECRKFCEIWKRTVIRVEVEEEEERDVDEEEDDKESVDEETERFKRLAR